MLISLSGSGWTKELYIFPVERAEGFSEAAVLTTF